MTKRRAPTPHRRPAVDRKRLFTGTYAGDPSHARRARVTVRRGATEIGTDPETGAELYRERMPGAGLWVDGRDRVFVFGPNWDDVMVADVITVYPDGGLLVAICLEGEVEVGKRPPDGPVHVMKAGRRSA